MRLYEVLNSGYFLGSHIELPSGRTTRAELQMPIHPKHHGVESVLERARPTHCLSRADCVFLADSQRGVVALGMPTAHVYAAQPVGDVQRSDVGWWRVIADALAHPDRKRAENINDLAAQYWSGTESLAPTWKYRVEAALIGR